MDYEWTLGDIYDDISERLAAARTKALMGERQEALGVFRGAALEYRRFQSVLKDYPGYHALEHAFRITLNALCDEENRIEERQTALALRQEAKPRRAKLKKAA